MPMVWILTFGCVMSVISAVFWIVEAREFFGAMKTVKRPTSKNPFILAFQCTRWLAGFIYHLPKVWKLVVDVLLTIFLTTGFGFGGLIGSIIGLTVSNVISVALYFYDKDGQEAIA